MREALKGRPTTTPVIRSRALVVFGLAFLWPYIRNVKTLMGAHVSGWVYMACAVTFYVAIIAIALGVFAETRSKAHAPKPRSVLTSPRLIAGGGIVVSLTLVLAFLVFPGFGEPSVLVVILLCITAILAGVYFSLISLAWSFIGGSPVRGKTLIVDAALSFFLSIVLLAPADIQVLTSMFGEWALLPRALYPALTGCCLAGLLLLQSKDSAPVEKSNPIEKSESACAWPAPSHALINAICTLILLECILIGLYLPNAITNEGVDYLNRLGPVALILAAIMVPCLGISARKPRAIVVTWGIVLLLIIAGVLISASRDATLASTGGDVLYVGRLAVWTLYWLMLVQGFASKTTGQTGQTDQNEQTAVVAAVALWFLPLRGLTNIIADSMRYLDPAGQLGETGLYILTVVLGLALIACAGVVIALWMAGLQSAASTALSATAANVSPSAATASTLGAPRPPTPDELRRQACEELACAKGLTERETATLEQLSRGFTIQRIADEQTVSANTVRTHTKGIYRKLGCHTKQEVIDLVEKRMRTLHG